ncbi:hypothetical protein [Aquisalinus flavus]|uniref:Uncharacterized protein n=1 Tax=Aquisalinus flavus TaxID=1526572 RepID=A0A8J2Y312_9PROT|nr:hypothetical protein [Aquisalinus flavus]MBD0426998.1 hypothetical protein [Aquisalinus flavus]UNE46830.1 hypothetical protein FF099_01535 [Aquisalinus flavus]GGC97563.1 hypothetical protein GCM10011342_03110 [Aquisalinus flavus]
MLSLLLDLSNILGGFLLAIGLLIKIPNIGDDLAKAAANLAQIGWVIGIVALVTGGYFLIVHVTTGPRLFHFEVVAIITGVLLLMDRVRAGRNTQDPVGSGASAFTTFVAIFGIIAIIVGFQGLFTPN